ncbi:MAG: ribose 5-phosphate isomerase B [candidate division Zixibacteria bacterium]|nr:ribose 5-phosphate isomerase B [candidate division Zixibacteria bacterium]
MNIAIGSDHAGLELKDKVIDYLKSKGLDVTNHGTDSKESTDYPEYAYKVTKDVIEGRSDKGILICWTGNGMVITANKVKGIRAGLCLNERMAELTRQHNDANVLCLASLFTKSEEAYKIIDKFLTSEFEGGRHSRRVSKIEKIENGAFNK